jgi:hypothetical protein
MRKLCLSVFLFAALSLSAPAQQETPPPTQAQFHAALETVKTNQAHWAGIINNAKVEQLPVNPEEARHVEDIRRQLNDGLQNVVLLAEHVEQQHSLFAETVFMSHFQNLQNSILHYSTSLLELQITDHAAWEKVREWARELDELAIGPMHEVHETTFRYVTNRAAIKDQTCPTK